MNSEEVKRFKELAKLNEEKDLPYGWVYVGRGRKPNLGFGDVLIANNPENCKYNWKGSENYRGESDELEYACPIDIWNKKVKSLELPDMFVVNFYSHRPLFDLLIDKLGSLGYDVKLSKEYYLTSRTYIFWDGKNISALREESVPSSVEEITINHLLEAEPRTIEIPECGLKIVGDTVYPNGNFSLSAFKKYGY